MPAARFINEAEDDFRLLEVILTRPGGWVCATDRHHERSAY